MFKIESYITPLLMGYVDKYVKLRPDDFQLSLWGGDAVLYNLDLRLDVIEKAMQLPIVFQSGHIHELRLHVPWTKLGSDPVVVTINTIECILKLRDTAYKDGRSSRAGSETPSKTKSPGGQKLKSRRQDTEDLPPGYLQSLMNKILNNVSIIVNNLIIKFVEDDIVLSLNVKSAECYSVNKDWSRAFAELSAPDFALRRAINFCDLTVCLDKRDASGKIENYQDPLVYRCSLSGRLYSKFESITAKYPLETKLNLYCEKADLSITDTQLPMFIRLIEMIIALYYGTIELKIQEGAEEPDRQNVEREADSGVESSVGEPPPCGDASESGSGDDQGWVSWAWSYVPALVTDEEEEDGEEGSPGGQPGGARKKPGPSIFSFGVYAYKLTITFKLTEFLKEKVHYGPRKIAFRPFLFLEAEGMGLDLLAQGLAFFDIQFGITNMHLLSRGPCICGADGEEHARNQQLLYGGEGLSNKTVNNYVCQSLFDLQSPENLGIPVSKIVNFEEHKQVYTEQYGQQKFGMFWLDYVYSMDNSVDTPSQSSRSSVSSLGDGKVFFGENSLLRFLIGQLHINVSSTTVHRIQKVIHAAYNSSYEPYSKKQEEIVDENRPAPTDEQVASLEEYIPTVTTHVTLLQPVISILSAEHVHCDVAKKSYRTHSGSGNTKSKSGSGGKQHPLFGLQLSSQRFDLQSTSPMYPRRLAQMVSKIAGPPSNLLHHCHSHTQMKVFGLMAGLTKVDAAGVRSPLVTVMPPSSGAMYTRKLILPVYWKNPYLPKFERIYELPQLTVSFSKPGMLVLAALVASWSKTNPRPGDLATADSLMDDMFPASDTDEPPRHAVLELSVSGFEMKNSKNEMVTAYAGTVSSLQAVIYKHNESNSSAVPIFSAPSNTDPIHSPDWLTQASSPLLEEANNDCVTFTYQLPRKPEHMVQAPAVALLNVEGVSVCVEPASVGAWLEYEPRSRVTQAKVELDMELAKAADPLQGNISQVSQPSSDSKRQSLSVTQTLTTGTLPTDPTQQRDGNQPRDGVGERLAAIFPVIRIIQVQIEMKKCCVFLPRTSLSLPPEPSGNIVQTLQTLARSPGSPESSGLRDMVVICLPAVQVHSAGLKTVAFLQEIPIPSMDGSLVGDKIPWNVSLRNFSVYTVHSPTHGATSDPAPCPAPLRSLQLVKPASVTCTVGVSYKYHPPTSDNITALGLCIHSDMHPVKMALSAEQIKLLTDVATQSVKLVAKSMSVMKTLSKTLAADNSRKLSRSFSHPPPAQPYSPTKMTQTASATSVTEGDFPYTATSDLTSLDTTLSREQLEIVESGSDGVRLSLWLQWTLPKWEICFYSSMPKQDELKLSVLLEDLTMSVDVQDVYAKLKVNMGAVNVRHYSRPRGQSEWEKGSQEGILMTCREELARDTHIVTSKLWSGELRHAPTDQSHGTTRELTHGFLNLTFTRALRKNVKRRLQKYNVEMPQANESGSVDISKQFHFFKYVSEICVILNPCDIVISMTPLVTILGSLSNPNSNPEVNKPSKTVHPSGVKKTREKKVVPWLTSSDLPLIYADLASVRMFVPGESGGLTKGDKPATTVGHDLVVMQVQSVKVVPHADNPLPRYAVNKELYQRAVQLGITCESGAALTDRQYQIDVRGVTVCTGIWGEFIRGQHKEAVASPSTQIPAVEWNTLAALQHKHEDIELFPLVSPCDMKLVAAPAIVNMVPVYGSSKLEKSLVCGYTMEFNVISDLDLHFSTNQVQLLQSLANGIMKKLTSIHNQRDDLNEDLDSGIGSDSTMKPPAADATTTTSKMAATKSSQNAPRLTPIDILLTAGRISCTVYSHGVAEKDIHIVREKSHHKESTKMKKSASKLELDWQLVSKEDCQEGGEQEYGNQTQAQYQDSYLMHMFERSNSVSEDRVIPAGSAYIDPFLFVYISQPHTVLSCHTDAEKFEMSCYDVLVKGPVDLDSLIQVSDQKYLPDCSDYTQYWLETRPGQADSNTGILPSLFTFTVLDFIRLPANIGLKLERPVRANISFVKLKQVEHFLEVLLPKPEPDPARESSPRPPSHDSKKPAPKTQSQSGVLSCVKHVEVHTDQVAVAMETKTCEEAPGVSMSFSNFKLAADLQHNDKDILTSVVLSSYLRDLLCKTAFCGRHLTLFGPCSVKLDGTVSQIYHNDVHHMSQCLVTVATGLVGVNVGQEHVMCLRLIGEHLQELAQELSRETKKSSTSTRSVGVKRTSSPKTPDMEGFTVHTSTDDLRSGEFKYIMDEDVTVEIPSPGLIAFCTRDRNGNSCMTWTYSQPRVISDITSTPIPFSLSGVELESARAACTLQYWEPLIQQFVDYAEMELSEGEATQAILPDIHAAHTRDLAVAQTWRIVINNIDSQVLVLPSSLAASMKVDSSFVPSLIPNFQLGCTLESLDLHLTNHVHCLGKETPTKLQPFFMSSCYPATGEFAVLQLGNVLVAGSQFQAKHSKTQLQFSSSVCLDILEYKMLTMQRIMSPFEISGTLNLQATAKPPVLDVDVMCEPVTVKLGQGLFHNLNCSLKAWNQILAKPTEEADEVIFGHYVICNDTQQPVRFGQVGTDENLLLQPREMHQYGWRSHKMKQEIHVCIDGTIWKWCDPVDINTPTTLVRSVSSSEQTYTLVITVKRISNVQNQIIISGQLVVSNRLQQPLEVKVVTSGSSGPSSSPQEHHAVVGGEHTVPSYIVEVKDILGVKIRAWGSKGPWSKETAVSGENGKESNLVKIVYGEQTYHIWCQVFTQKLEKAQMIFVVLCPLYTVRSHLPYPLYINIDTSKLDTHRQLEAPGQGRDLQLQCPGGDVHHALTFQFSATSNKSSSGVTLSTGLIEQLQRAPPAGEISLASLQDYWRDECWFHWPYTGKCKLEEDAVKPDRTCVQVEEESWGGQQPSIDLNVSLSELWPGCHTVLVDITPSYLINNVCDLDLLVMGNEDITYDLGKGQTISPPKLEGSFHIGVKAGGGYCMSAPIPVSEEEVGAQRYRNDVGKTLFLDSHVQMPIFVEIDGQTQVFFLTVTSSVKHQIRVMSIKETFCFTNLTKYDLCLRPFTLPRWSKKVDIPASTTINIPSHLGCTGETSDLLPLTSQPLLLDQEADKSFEIDQTTEFLHYVTIKGSSEEKEGSSEDSQSHSSLDGTNTATNDNRQSDWSFPVRLSANENGSRMSSSVTINRDGRSQCVALCLVGQSKQGCTYFTIHVDQAPACYLENKCEFPLVFGQTLMNLSLSGTTIHEQTELVNLLPSLPPGGSTYYTPPFLDTNFPQIGDKHYLPKFHIAASSGDQDSKLVWSQPIDLHVSADNFVSLAGVADVKVHISHVSMVTLIVFEPITKADVSAREIRSRLKGKEKTVVVESGDAKKSDSLSTNASSAIKHDPSHHEMGSLSTEAVAQKHKDKEKVEVAFPMQISLGLLVQQVSVVIQDELSSPAKSEELVRLTIDDLFVAMYPASSFMDHTGYHRNCFVFSAGDVQLDNQMETRGNYDFPVVVIRQNFNKSAGGNQSLAQAKPVPETDYLQLCQMNLLEKHAVLKSTSLVHVQVVLGSFKHSRLMVDSVEVAAQPLSFYIDDTFVFRFVKEVERFIPVPLSRRDKPVTAVHRLPASVKSVCMPIASPVVIGHLSVQPLRVLLSVHASLKLFIASDDTPLTFGAFERLNVKTTQYQLIKSVAMHYASGALFRAGAVVGSLEILGNPTGLVRSIGTGVADMFRMPYRGLARGPGAFVVGVSQGMSSMVKNVTTGTLKSVTNFASSVSRNMDRLSLDGSHQQRQEASRRHRPDGVGDGLKNGLTGLGISLLGAVAGLADQPIQSFINTETSSASSLVAGMGKGLVGVFTKPIGGAAEFVSQTGQGILHGTGLSQFPQPRVQPVILDVAECPCGQLKYALKLLQSLPSNDILCCMEASHIDLTDSPVPVTLILTPEILFVASHIDLTDSPVPVTLILTPEILFVVNHEEDAQQQSFAVQELDCGVTMGDNPTLSIVWRDAQTIASEQFGPSNTERVTAFIDGTTQFMTQTQNPPLPDPPRGLAVPDQPQTQDNIQHTSFSQKSDRNTNNRSETSPDCEDASATKGGDYEPDGVVDLDSDSSESDMCGRITTLPQYDFQMDATKLAAFLAIFNITKHKLEGTGFAL